MDVLSLPKYLWEGGAESWCCLHSWKTDFPNVITILETKDGLDLVSCDALFNAEDLTIEVWHGTMKTQVHAASA